MEKIAIYHHERVAFVLLGLDAQMSRASHIEQSFNATILNLVGRTPTLEDHYALLEQMDVVVGTDGGSINAAIALQTPVVDIFNIIDPHKILPPSVSQNGSPKIRHILAPCQDRCHGIDGAHTCRVTGQSEFETDRGEVPCLEAVETTRIAALTIEALFEEKSTA